MEQEALYVKESLARLVVELAKKTWPQQWPTFLGDLDVLTRCGVCTCTLCVWECTKEISIVGGCELPVGCCFAVYIQLLYTLVAERISMRL